VVPGAAAVDATRRLFDEAGYVGLGNAQFFERDGRFSVHDVNLRPPASIGFALHAGFDAPALGVAAVMDEPLPLRAPAGPRFRYVSADEEIRALASALRNGGRSAAPSIVGRALAAGVRPHDLLDPPLSDIDWICGRVGVAFRRAARVARNAAARA
jgi:predicted ATP-grasp superfamily ATP-dependent carboligase